MNQTQNHYSMRHSPGLFWPIVLIGVGVIWLLGNLGVLTVNPLSMLWRLWPVLLIVIGIDILLRRSGILGAVVSALLGLLVVGGVVAFLLLAQNNPAWLANNPAWFGTPIFSGNGDLRTAHLADPVNEAHRADVTIGFPGGDGAISASSASGNLLEGDVSYYGNLTHTVSRNNDTAVVELRSESGAPWFLFGNQQKWDLRMNPSVEYALQLDVGSGSCNFDLSQLTLSSLGLDHGSGSTRLDLPKSGQYRFTLDMGSGSVDVHVPAGLPTRVEFQVGSGSLNVPKLQRVSGDSRNGAYESSGFSQTGAYVIINVDLGSGSVTIQ